MLKREWGCGSAATMSCRVRATREAVDGRIRSCQWSAGYLCECDDHTGPDNALVWIKVYICARLFEQPNKRSLIANRQICHDTHLTHITCDIQIHLSHLPPLLASDQNRHEIKQSIHLELHRPRPDHALFDNSTTKKQSQYKKQRTLRRIRTPSFHRHRPKSKIR